MQQFSIIPNQQVNRQRWNACITQSPHGLVYAQGWYLDHMHPNWQAMVGDDYSWVMPVTAAKKWGVRYLFQPHFTQQLGVFACGDGTQVPWAGVLHRLQQQYRFWEIALHHNTPPAVLKPLLQVSTATNFVLPLHTDYTAIQQGYLRDLQRNLKQSHKHRLVYRHERNVQVAIDLYRQHYAARMPQVQPADFDRFTQLVHYAHQHGNALCRTAINQQNQVMAIVLLLHDEKRLYNLANTTTQAGRKAHANHFLLNEVVREFAGSGLLLDFEGSDLPGVKEFYQNFGAANQPFYQVKYNGLPWPLRLLKR